MVRAIVDNIVEIVEQALQPVRLPVPLVVYPINVITRIHQTNCCA